MKSTPFRLRVVVGRNILLCSAFAVSASVCRAQTNNIWINPGSGHWEDGTNWALGIPPGPEQSIIVSINGYKAVAVFPSTPINFPSTMTVHDLTLSAIPGSFNTLLLNYSGTDVPLHVLNQCVINQNSRILNLYSGFRVDGALTLNYGQFAQAGGTLAVSGPTALTNGGLMLTNAQAVLGSISLVSSHLQLVGASLTAAGFTNLGTFDQLGSLANCKFDGVDSSGVMIILGGTFSAQGIVLRGTMMVSNAVLANAPFLDLEGTLQVRDSTVQFGPLTLSVSPRNLSTNTTIDFGSNACTLRFSDSSSSGWDPSSRLRIFDWAGSPAGGGSGGIFFGNNGFGLQSNQLQQIVFFRPVGFLPGLYRPRLLASGEVVPTGKVSVFGWNSSGASYDPASSLAAPAGLTNIIAIAASEGRSIGLRRDGTVLEWRDPYWESWPQSLNGLSNVVAISGGSLWTMALRADETAVPDSGGPIFSNIVAICGWDFNVAIRDGGDLLFEDEYEGTNSGPVGWTNLVELAGGDDFAASHLLGLKADGTVVAWSPYISPYDDYSQTNVPVGLSNVVAIAAGASESLALKSDGHVVAWGPYPAPPLSNVVAIAATADYSVALHSDGTVTTWGNISVDVGLSNVVAIAAGNWHSLALLEPLPIKPFSLSPPHQGTNGSMRFNFQGHLGHRYLIEWSTNLSDWSFLCNVAGRNGSTEISDDRPGDVQRFYRTRTIQ